MCKRKDAQHPTILVVRQPASALLMWVRRKTLRQLEDGYVNCATPLMGNLRPTEDITTARSPSERFCVTLMIWVEMRAGVPTK